jgi:hypothetical protein
MMLALGASTKALSLVVVSTSRYGEEGDRERGRSYCNVVVFVNMFRWEAVYEQALQLVVSLKQTLQVVIVVGVFFPCAFPILRFSFLFFTLLALFGLFSFSRHFCIFLSRTINPFAKLARG